MVRVVRVVRVVGRRKHVLRACPWPTACSTAYRLVPGACHLVPVASALAVPDSEWDSVCAAEGGGDHVTPLRSFAHLTFAVPVPAPRPVRPSCDGRISGFLSPTTAAAPSFALDGTTPQHTLPSLPLLVESVHCFTPSPPQPTTWARYLVGRPPSARGWSMLIMIAVV